MALLGILPQTEENKSTVGTLTLPARLLYLAMRTIINPVTETFT